MAYLSPEPGASDVGLCHKN